jgi:hypothetical protein
VEILRSVTRQRFEHIYYIRNMTTGAVIAQSV